MGAVFGIILGTPIGLLMSLIIAVYGFFTGTDKTELILPYDESNGIVWEYDGVDDPYLTLVDTKTDGDSQIFTFRRKNSFITKDTGDGKVMKIIFTDRNGNEMIYYAVNDDSDPFIINFYTPEDVNILEYTVKAEKPLPGGHWALTSGSSYNTSSQRTLYTPFENTETFTFTIVTPKNDSTVRYIRKFDYLSATGREKEYVLISFSLDENDEFVILSEEKGTY